MDDANSCTFEAADPVDDLRRQGFACLTPAGFARIAGVPVTALARWAPLWDSLPPDRWLRDGGRYRRRRHGSFVVEPAGVRCDPAPHRAHWQPVDYNALHGGIERMFDPLDPALAEDPGWRTMLLGLGAAFEAVAPAGRWFVEAHQFRIDTTDGVGRPTPEGAHRDGVDFVAVILIARHHVKGGETRVFEADGPRGLRFVISEPWSAVLLDDLKVIHETTPIQPDGPDAHRDTLVLTYRRGGFLSPETSR